MFFKTFYSYVRLHFLALAESIMSSPPPLTIECLFPAANHNFEVDYWNDYAVRDEYFPLTTSCIVTEVTHCKSTRRKGHEFLIVDMELQHEGKACTTSVMTDRGPKDCVPPPSSATSSKLSILSNGNSSKIISSKPVTANDRVCVPRDGGRAFLDALVFQEHGIHNIVCTLSWPNANSPRMSAAQLAVLLRTVNKHNGFYKLDSHSCYWYAYTVAEVIRRQFQPVQTEGAVFGDRGKYFCLKPSLEDSVNAVIASYDEAWTALVQRAEDKKVSRMNLSPKNMFTHLNMIGRNPCQPGECPCCQRGSRGPQGEERSRS